MQSSELASISASARLARSRIAAHIAVTPVIASRERPGLLFKAEQFQTTGSFKLRGALSRLTNLPLDHALITASSGNHGIACAHAARITGHALTVVLPESVTEAKRAKIASYGVEILLHGCESGAAETHARALAETGAYSYVSPYNDPEVIAGQGTLGLELLEQLPDLDRIYISMGGGGLISGIGSVLKTARPSVQVIGVSATNSAALAASISAGEVVETTHSKTLADGCAGGMDPGSLTLPVASAVIDRVIHCSEAEIAKALSQLAWGENMLVEGAAALALAGYHADAEAVSSGVSVILLCGGNFDRETIEADISRQP